MTNLTSLTMGLEANGVTSPIDCMTAELYANLFALPSHAFRNAKELAQELMKANENGADWNRFTILSVLPREDQNFIHRMAHGIRLY